MAFSEIFDRFCKTKSAVADASHGDTKTINIFLGFFFMINYVIGAGFLGIPYAFYHTGLIVGMVSLAVISFVSWCSSTWVVETMSRAQVQQLIVL